MFEGSIIGGVCPQEVLHILRAALIWLVRTHGYEYLYRAEQALQYTSHDYGAYHPP